MKAPYYLNDGHETTGPFSVADLQARLAAGALPDHLLLHDGQAWVPAAAFLRNLAAPTADHAVPPPAPLATPRPGSDPDQALREALRLEPPPAPLVDGARWESLLFLLSFPVLIPSLILMFVLAKRWGHIDIYLIIIDGLIFTALGFLTTPWLGGVLLLSWVASVWLYWIRRDVQREGIFLGYSIFVSLLLIVGGALTLGGFAALFPWNAYARWSATCEAPIMTTVERARDRALPRDRTLVLQDAKLDLAQAVERHWVDGSWQFVSPVPPAARRYEPGDLRQAWSAHRELHGREVELHRVIATEFGGPRDRVEIMDGAAKSWHDAGGRHFTLVNGSEGRIWIAAAARLTPGIVTLRGTARVFYQDAATASAYARLGRGPLPLMGLAVFDGEVGPPPPPPPQPEASEVWVPVKDQRGAFWIRFPAGVRPTGQERAAGYYVGEAESFPGLGSTTAEKFSRDHSRVLYQQTPDRYRQEEKILEQLRPTIASKSGGWLAAGLLILGVAVWRARHE